MSGFFFITCYLIIITIVMCKNSKYYFMLFRYNNLMSMCNPYKIKTKMNLLTNFLCLYIFFWLHILLCLIVLTTVDSFSSNWKTPVNQLSIVIFSILNRLNKSGHNIIWTFIYFVRSIRMWPTYTSNLYGYTFWTSTRTNIFIPYCVDVQDILMKCVVTL